MKDNIGKIIGDYKYGFKTDAESVVNTGKGLSLDVVKAISKYKGEPDWMLDFRVKAYQNLSRCRCLILARVWILLILTSTRII